MTRPVTPLISNHDLYRSNMVFFRAFLHVLEQNDYGGKNSRLVTTEEMKGKS